MWSTAAIAAFGLFVLICTRVDSKTFRWVGALALAGHIIIASFVIPRLPFHWDISTFHQVAVSLLNGQPVATSFKVKSFAAVQASVYYLFGASPETMGVINGLFAVLIALPAAYLSRALYPDLKTTDGLKILILLLPLPFFFLTLPMRDTLSVLLMFTGAALVARSFVRDELWPAVASVPVLVVLGLFRPEMVMIILIGTAAAVGFRLINAMTHERLSVRSVVVLTAVVGVISLAVTSILQLEMPISGLNGRVAYRSSGGAGYLDGMQYTSLVDLVLDAPIRAIYFQFAPFPLHVNGAFDLVTVLSLPILIIITVSAYRSIRSWQMNPDIYLFLLVMYIFGVVGYGLIDSNFGTTVRHRIPFVFLLLVFSAPVIQRWELLLRRRFGEAPTERRNEREHYAEG